MICVNVDAILDWIYKHLKYASDSGLDIVLLIAAGLFFLIWALRNRGKNEKKKSPFAGRKPAEKPSEPPQEKDEIEFNPDDYDDWRDQ